MVSLYKWFLVFCLLVLGGCATNNRPLQLLSGAGPIYPAAAKAQNIEGYVVVQYDVNIQGQVVNAQVVESHPKNIFDMAAIKAVSSWKFNAPRMAGKAVPAENIRSRVQFKLGESDEYSTY